MGVVFITVRKMGVTVKISQTLSNEMRLDPKNKIKMLYFLKQS